MAQEDIERGLQRVDTSGRTGSAVLIYDTTTHALLDANNILRQFGRAGEDETSIKLTEVVPYARGDGTEVAFQLVGTTPQYLPNSADSYTVITCYEIVPGQPDRPIFTLSQNRGYWPDGKEVQSAQEALFIQAILTHIRTENR